MERFKKLLAFLFTFLAFVSIALAQQEGTIPFNGGALYYQSHGKGKTIIFVHAGFQDHAMWQTQVEHFKKNYRVITFDLPGHGKSTSGNTRPVAAAVVKAVLDSLHINKAAVVGLSLGGAVATDFAVQHPDRVDKLVLVGSGLSGWDENRKVDTTTTQYVKDLFGALEKKDTALAAETFVRYWYVGPNRKKTAVADSVYQYGMQITHQNMLQHRVSGWPQFAQPAAIHKLNALSVPLLIVTGTHDMPEVLLMNKWLKEHVKGAQQVFVENTAHMVNLEKPAHFNQLLETFLQQ